VSSNIAVEQEVAPRAGCRTFVVSYYTDGLRVFSLMSRPPSAPPAGGFPVLILAHGYIPPDTYQTTGTDYQDFINHYCNAGYLVFKPDYRGHGQSEGTATGGHFSPDYTYDILNLAASLHTATNANPSRIGLLGHSMGGHVVLRALVASHGLPIKAAVIAGGVVGSLEDIAYQWPENEIPPDVVPIRDRILAQIGTPAQNPAFWHDGSAINYVSDITAPVQINHGDADAVVPLTFPQHLNAALTAAHKTHEFYIYPGGDHQFSAGGTRLLFFDRSTAFLNANL
jgi:uncharacterized protein